MELLGGLNLGVSEIQVLPTAVSMGDIDTPPLPADLVIVRFRIIHGRTQPKMLSVQPADSGQKRIGAHHDVTLGGDEVDLGVQELLLGVENVEERSLAHPLFFANTRQGYAV